MPEPANYNKLVLAHGVTMALALLWFIPIAIFAAAFLRPQPSRPLPESDKAGTLDAHSYEHRQGQGKGRFATAWKYVHIIFNITATALIIAGFTLGYEASGNSFQTGSKNAHFVRLLRPRLFAGAKLICQIIGLTFFLGILIQALYGSAMVLVNGSRKNLTSTRRPWYNYPHILLGYPLALLGVANIWLGLQFHGSPHYLYGLWIAAVAVWFVIFLFGIEFWRLAVAKKHKNDKVADEKRYNERSDRSSTAAGSLNDTRNTVPVSGLRTSGVNDPLFSTRL